MVDNLHGSFLNFYFKEKKYDQAVEAYNDSIENSNSANLKLKVYHNLCKTFYKMKMFEKCKQQAHMTLNHHVNDPIAHLWLALVYLKEEKGIRLGNQSKDICVNDNYGELSYALGALTLHFSSQDTRINKILDKH